MDKNTVINILIFSLAIGFVLGQIALVPYVGLVAILFLCFMSAPIAVLLLIMAGKLDLTSVKDSIIQGAFSGFCANSTFCIGYCITSSLIFSILNHTTNYFLTAMIIKSPLFLLLMVIMFTGVLIAVTNAFSNFCLYYIINYIRDNYERNHRQ